MRKLGFVIFGVAIILIAAGVVVFFLPEKQVSNPESSKTIKNESEKPKSTEVQYRQEAVPAHARD